MPYQFEHLSGKTIVLSVLTGTVLATSCQVQDLSDSSVHLDRIVTQPKQVRLRADQSQRFIAYGITESGDTVATPVVWGAPQGAVTPDGLFTPTEGSGEYVVTATAQSEPLLTDSSVVVVSEPLDHIVIYPSRVSLLTNDSTVLTVVGLTASEDTVDVNITWSSRSGGDIRGNGKGKGLFKSGSKPGKHIIIAEAETGQVDSAEVNVVARVAHVGLSPDNATLSVGASLQLVVVTTDSAGEVLSDRAIDWSSTNPVVATVTAEGLVTGRSTGPAQIIAAVEGKADTANVTVTMAVVQVETVTVSPSTAVMATGQDLQLTATVRDADGNQLFGIPVSWTSSDTNLATVSDSGLVTAWSTGRVTITAEAGNRSATATVTIQQPNAADPILFEDFSSYTSTSHMMSDPRGIYANFEDVGSPVLDFTGGFGNLSQSMRYTFQDRTNSGGSSTTGRCGSASITRVFDLRDFVPGGGTVLELWAEVHAKFSANFDTRAPGGWGCTSNPDYKFIFGTVFWANGASDSPENRFGYNVGNGPSAHFLAGHPELVEEPVLGNSEEVWDGEYHQYRFHMKCNDGGLNSNTGTFKIWLDGNVQFDFGVIDCDRTIWGFELGANLNQGPAEAMTVHWGQVKLWIDNPGWEN